MLHAGEVSGPESSLIARLTDATNALATGQWKQLRVEWLATACQFRMGASATKHAGRWCIKSASVD